jgi:hypothetical protein
MQYFPITIAHTTVYIDSPSVTGRIQWRNIVVTGGIQWRNIVVTGGIQWRNIVIHW